MAALKGIIAFIVIIVIVVILWYFTTGFRLPGSPLSSTSSVSSQGSSSTTTISNGTDTTTILYNENCTEFSIFTQQDNATVTAGCHWTGGYLGFWVGSGNAGSEHIKIVGADGRTYVNQTSNYQCVTFFENFSAPAQEYLVNLTSGPGTLNTSSTCTDTIGILNTTTTPPQKVTYDDFVYNGNFSSGAYTGWNVTGKGFGAAPINLTKANVYMANSPNCYINSPWSNYVGTFFATTFNCGTSVAPGNLTSSPFYAGKSFLNFKIISTQDNFLYVEILYNGTPYIIAHYNTYNITAYGANAPSTFRNASIPLVTVANKPIQIRVFADTLKSNNYIAVGDFVLSNRPNQDKGIISQPYQFTT